MSREIGGIELPARRGQHVGPVGDHVDPRGPHCGHACAGHERVGVDTPDEDSADARLDEPRYTRRRLLVPMRTGLKRYVDRGAGYGSRARSKGVCLSMGTAELFVISLAQRNSVVRRLHDDAAHHRIGLDKSAAAHRQLQRLSHPPRIGRSRR